MERLQSYEGLVKWAALGATVIALECVGQSSLTSHARRALEHPVGRVVVPVLGTVTLLHLLDRCPPPIDPYEMIGATVNRIKKQ